MMMVVLLLKTRRNLALLLAATDELLSVNGCRSESRSLYLTIRKNSEDGIQKAEARRCWKEQERRWKLADGRNGCAGVRDYGSAKRRARPEHRRAWARE